MRLIDADKGIEEYKEIRRKLIEKGADLFGDEIDGLDYIIRQLELQPTAYDVEAVVRELEERYNEAINQYRSTAEPYYCGLAYGHDIAIEIVRGGRND